MSYEIQLYFVLVYRVSGRKDFVYSRPTYIPLVTRCIRGQTDNISLGAPAWPFPTQGSYDRATMLLPAERNLGIQTSSLRCNFLTSASVKCPNISVVKKEACRSRPAVYPVYNTLTRYSVVTIAIPLTRGPKTLSIQCLHSRVSSIE